ncbi:MAG: hypothetical protein R3E99_00315 [Burkholderiaceae bacterium]
MFTTAHRGANMLHTILRIPAVKGALWVLPLHIYLRIGQGLWTSPVSLGPRRGLARL